MEAAAIGIAKNALNSVVKTAKTAITNEIGLLLGVQEELFFIKEELQMMQGFLQASSADKVKGVVVSIWVEQVQELAFDVEDCLHEASVYLIEKSCLPIMFSVKKRDHIARKIRVLKTRIEDVSKRNQRYNLINKDNDGQTYNESASTRPIAYVKALLVGLDGPKKTLVDLIEKDHAEVEEEPWKGKVISVVGMGGLGKTTLVREVYGCEELRDKFKYFAWVTIQHPFHKDEFIESLAKQIPFDDEERLAKIPIEEKVKNSLKDKRYLIVLDDMSSQSEWVKIKDVLPVVHRSRIIVTTRYRKPLAESISDPSDNIYDIKKLCKEDAIDLFYKAVYKTSNYHLEGDAGPSGTEKTKEDSEVQNQGKINTVIEEKDRKGKGILLETMDITDCSSNSTNKKEEESELQNKGETNTITKEMKTKAELIIESCGRLPLAIVTIGSYLTTKPKGSVEWNKMHEELSSELINNPELGKVNTVLTSSYDRLPYHLKPSLLYLSVFHNHKEIRQSRIIRRWMADGYVMEGRKKMAEDVGKDYLNDLIGRNLIQPSGMSTIVNGDIKRCNIHDIMYELILAKAMHENIVSLLEDENLITMTDKVRHLVITGESFKGKVLERVKLSHMRSLSIFGEVGDHLSYHRMKLVRVLDLEGTLNLNDGDLRNIGKLHLLKYLGLRGTKIKKLPNSLGKLSELETLDIRNTCVLLLPTGVTKLHKLSYLRAGSNDYFYHQTPMKDKLDDIAKKIKLKRGDNFVSSGVQHFTSLCWMIPNFPCYYLEKFEESKVDRLLGGVRVPRGIGKLRSLNNFGTIDIAGSNSLAKEMQNLTNLRKLAVTGFTENNGKTLGEVINGLKHLRSLVLKAKDESGLLCCLNAVSSPLKYLQSLKLHSDIVGQLPDWISSLENLEKIHFKCTYLMEGIEVIEKLPNLKILYMLENSLGKDMKKLCFSKGTFPMLEVMNLEEIDSLESVSIEKTSLKKLEQLKINRCWYIEDDGLSGLKFLLQLKEMEVRYTDRNKNLGANIEEQLKNHPKEHVLRLIKNTDAVLVAKLDKNKEPKAEEPKAQQRKTQEPKAR